MSYLKWSQSQGLMTKVQDDGSEVQLGKGWAGRNVGDQRGQNNPALEGVKGIGPLPKGWYGLGAVVEHHPVVGAYAIPLSPDAGNQMYGRSSFLIHGADAQNPGGSSHGCIVLYRPVREAIVASGIQRLLVIE